jgi:glycosyltransferase involved in cell wall biosynthesis
MSKLKVLHYSTHNEDCGIGKYQEQFVAAMKKVADDEIDNEFFEYSPNVTKHMSYDEFSVVLDQLKHKLEVFDILHIQHEVSFYAHDELLRIVEAAQGLGKKVIITVHTALRAQYKTPRRNGYGPHSIIAYLREKKVAAMFVKTHVLAIKKADLILVHNQATREGILEFGVDDANVQMVTLPVPSLSFDLHTDEIKNALHYQKDDVIMGLVGFISHTKGAKAAVKALNYLPSNYKLALVGGVHPSGSGEYLDGVCDLIARYKLQDRVYITGYVQDDNYLNALIRECDVCIYPYDNEYYKYVSSAALNNALANFKPAVVYPTQPFVEMNGDDTIAVCKSANYYELARYVTESDYEKLSHASKKYAQKYGYDVEAEKLIKIYTRLLS